MTLRFFDAISNCGLILNQINGTRSDSAGVRQLAVRAFMHARQKSISFEAQSDDDCGSEA